MPANCAGATADVKTCAGSFAPLLLQVEVQFSEVLVAESAPERSALPSVADLEHWAQQAFASAHANGWDTQWRQRIGATTTDSEIDSSQLCIRLVDAVEGEALNATWRNKQVPTNVLSFEADIVAGHYAPLGDLVLCGPVIEGEALQQGKSVAHHCAHLVVHGVLHLLGFDHLIEAEAQAMEAMETQVLGELGIGNPYE